MDFDDPDPEEEVGLPRPSAKLPTTPGSTSAAAASPSSSSSATWRYRECLKNHAVNIGGHAVDGCGEFMPAGDDGSLDALRCAACNCHRNFHRKEPHPHHHDVITPTTGGPHHHQFSPYYRTPAGYLHHHVLPSRAHVHQPLALPSTSGGRDEDELSDPNMLTGPGSGSGKKRFRTKFTQEQKDKMLAFAERVGWRIQKQDEAAVQEFCNETGVKRHVLKVWMHNNKHTLGKKP